MRKWIILGLLLLGATPAWAANSYYVSTTGNDANSCTQAQNIATPKRNINGTSGGLACLVSGDTLYLRAGTYAEAINPGVLTGIPSGGGSWATATTISRYQNELVTLTGRSGGATINLNATISYVIFNGLTIDQGGAADHDGISLYTNGSLTSHHLRVSNCEVKNIYMNGIAANGTGSNDGFEFINNLVHDTGLCTTLSPQCGGAQPHGFYVHGTNMIIDGNTIYKSLDLGIQVYGPDSSNTIIRNNKVYDNCHMSGQSCAGIITGSGSNIQVYNNIVHDNGFTGGASNGSGIAFGNVCSSCLVYNNVVYHNQTDGIENAKSPNGGIYNNTIYDNGVYAILVQNFGANNNTIRNNILWSNGTDAVTVEAGVTGTVQSNNLTSDPKFVAPAAVPPNFHLQNTSPNISPAINAGFTVAAVTTDIEGNTRPQPAGGAYDIGAYEWTATGGTVACPP